MNLITSIVVYVMVWWIVFFMALPINIRVEKAQKGHASSAPINPALRKKILYSSLVSLVLWGVICWALESKIIPLDMDS